MWKILLPVGIVCACSPSKPTSLSEVERAALQQVDEAFGRGEYDRAIKLVDDLLKKGRTPALLTVKGLAKLRSGKPKEAAKVLDEAQGLDPANVGIAAMRVRAYLLDTAATALDKMPANAAAKLTQALELAKSGPPGGDPYVIAVRMGEGDKNKTADALLRIGQSALRERRNDEALAAFGEAVLLAPQAPNARLLLGSALYNMKAYKPAIGQLGEAAKLEPRLVGAWKLLGHCYTQLGEKPSALEAYRRVIALSPNDVDVEGALARLEGRPMPPPPTPQLPGAPAIQLPGAPAMMSVPQGVARAPTVSLSPASVEPAKPARPTRPTRP